MARAEKFVRKIVMRKRRGAEAVGKERRLEPME
jgi:hypothetical protein